MKREIIHIDNEKCDGCGLCIPECHEGALQIIDEKAVLVSDLMCDGLGACIGHCPQDALTIEEREAAPYDEVAVMKEMVAKGRNVVIAHMKHLKDHQENAYLKEGVKYLMENKHLLEFDPAAVISEVHNHGKPQTEAAPGHQHVRIAESVQSHSGGGCPGSKAMSFEPAARPSETAVVDQPSELRQWPVQGHLVNPGAGYFQGSDLLVAADCVAFSLGNFHSKHLKNKSLFIACPKLDSNQEVYHQKLVALIDQAQVNTVTVMVMEVPCCGGLLQMVQSAADQAQRKVPIKVVQVGVQGEILAERWV
jgi:NAD-dependent dihydropyrimidine dehydrogenase PreA subunit